jgi:hypothetical protein
MLIALGILIVLVPLLAFALTRWLDRKEAREAPQRAAEDDAAYKDWEVRRLWAAVEAGDESARIEWEALGRVKKAEAEAEAEARRLAQQAQWDAEHKVVVDAVDAAKRKEQV